MYRKHPCKIRKDLTFYEPYKIESISLEVIMPKKLIPWLDAFTDVVIILKNATFSVAHKSADWPNIVKTNKGNPNLSFTMTSKKLKKLYQVTLV